MVVLTLFAVAVLAGALITAAVAKFRSPRAFTGSVAAFGVPAMFVPAVAALVPAAELAIGAALLVPPTRAAAAAAAAVLLVAFTGAIAVNLWQGRTPECRCFGAASTAPIGWPTVLRNLALLACAVVAYRWPSIALTRDDVALMAPLAACAGLAYLVLLLWRQQGRLLLRLEQLEQRDRGAGERAAAPAGLPVGTAAPAFSARGLDGRIRTLDDLRDGRRPLLLLFTDPACGPCTALLPDVARWQQQSADRLAVAVISRGAEAANAIKARELRLRDVLLQESHEVMAAFASAVTPSAVLLDANGRIASELAKGAQQIAGLVQRTVGVAVVRPEDANSLPAAAGPVRFESDERPPLPSSELPDLAGRLVKVSASPAGRETLLVFWDATCAHCTSMLPALRAAATAVRDAIVIVARGSEDALRAQQLPGLVLVDQGFALGGAVGVPGTPSALRFDGRGRIATSIAAGPTEVVRMFAADTEPLAAESRIPVHA